MSESDNKEKGNLKEERPKSNKASSKLHTKIEKEKETDQGKKEKETDQGKAKQKHSGLYPVLDEFSDLTLSDSAEDELESEEEEDLEEAAAAYEQERGAVCVFPQHQENLIWIPERLTHLHFIRHEDPDPDTSDKPDSSSDQSWTRDAVVGSDQNVADPDASAC
ncbi:hypothetical protein STEG23_022185 [Scotinomys teguina]